MTAIETRRRPLPRSRDVMALTLAGLCAGTAAALFISSKRQIDYR
jgi:hypothetical protein